MAHDRDVADDGEAGRVKRHDHHRIPFISLTAIVRRSASHDDGKAAVRMTGTGREPFTTANTIVVAIPCDGRLKIGWIRACRRWLRHREARAYGAFKERIEPALALFRRRAELQYFHVPAVRGIAIEDFGRPRDPAGNLSQGRIFEIG